MKPLFRKKIYYILTGVPLFLLLCYQLAFAKTFSLYRENRLLEQKIDRISSSMNQLKVTDPGTWMSDSVVLLFKMNAASENRLLDSISKRCQAYGAVITDFPPVTIHEQNKVKVATTNVVVKGSFHSLVRLMNSMEKGQGGNLSSSSLFVKEDMYTKKKELYLSLIFQGVINE